MSKEVLVMDMPESCMGCNFMYCDEENNTESCQAREKARIVDLEKEDKPDWCPMHPMPEKKEKVVKGHRMGIVSCAFADGWNDCIDVICGEE